MTSAGIAERMAWAPDDIVIRVSRAQPRNTADVAKVGPEGYIHGWIRVGSATGEAARLSAPIHDDASLRAATTATYDLMPGVPVDKDIDVGGVSGEDVRDALSDYSSNGYETVNHALRSSGGDPDEFPSSAPIIGYSAQRAASIMTGVDAAMGASKLRDNVTAYRGIANPARTFGPAWQSDGSMIGTKWVDHGYVSTTAGTSALGRFTANGAGIQLKITAPAGMGAIGIQNSGSSTSENELLLDRGAAYTVTGDSIGSNGIRTLDVTVEPRGSSG
jgi:hypothetical protein